MSTLKFWLLLVLSIGVLHAASTNHRFCMSIMRMDCAIGFAPNIICGSDGVTYPNDCAFSKAMCQRTNLNELHKGPCVVTTIEPTTLEPTTEEPTTLEPTTEEPTTESIENRFCKTITERRCDDIKDEFICGTDGQTYRNDCLFSKAMCKDWNLDEDYKGPCVTPTTKTEDPVTELTTQEPSSEIPITEEPTTLKITTETAAEVTTSSAIETTIPDNCISCMIILKGNCTGYQDTCIYGSDGFTYPNDCEFTKAICRDKNLKELHRGSCVATTETPVSTELLSTFFPTTKEPPTSEVATSEITTEEIVTVDLATATTESPSTVTMPGHRVSTLDFRPIIKEFFCTWSWGEELECDPSSKDYTCASDHQTYRTKCDLAKAHCDYPTLHIVKEGICPGDTYAVEYKHHSFVSHIIMP